MHTDDLPTYPNENEDVFFPRYSNQIFESYNYNDPYAVKEENSFDIKREGFENYSDDPYDQKENIKKQKRTLQKTTCEICDFESQDADKLNEHQVIKVVQFQSVFIEYRLYE